MSDSSGKDTDAEISTPGGDASDPAAAGDGATPADGTESPATVGTVAGEAHEPEGQPEEGRPETAGAASDDDGDTSGEEPDADSAEHGEPNPEAPVADNGDRGLTARQEDDARRAEKQAETQARREERRKQRRSRPKVKKLRFALVLAGLSLLAVVSWVFGIMMAVANDLPDLEARAQYDRAQNSVVLASDGETKIATLTGNQRRILLESSEISPLIKQAVVAIEDERFYEHRGVDYMGIARALREDILAGGAVQGGSTITQQFVKNALAAQGSRSVLQKLREAALAYQIERQWSKDKILTNYLNNIYFGEGAYGIEAAAKAFFGDNHPGCGDEGNRCAEVLRVEEAAMLAGMIASPTAYSPKANPEDAVNRRNTVLFKMRELGSLAVSDGEYEELLASSGPARTTIEPPTEDSDAPFFTDWLRQQVVDKFGAGEAFGGGLQVHSTLNAELQSAAQEAVEGRLSGLGPTAAVVVIDNSDASILAMVGGDNFEKSPFNLATNGRRQPGSSFKPFTLVTALENGHTPTDVYESAPIEIPFEAKVERKNGKMKKVTDLFEVNNYEDSYLGSATLTDATTYSDNSVYAQLGTEVGTQKVARTAKEMGIHSPVPKNPAMILGGMKRGVTPLEMAYAFTTIANDGARVSGTLASRGNGRGPVAIKKVVDEDGDPVTDDTGASGENERIDEQVLDPTVAQQAKEMLHTVVTSGTGQRAQVGDDFIWGKTGTTDNNADAWFVGANEQVTAAVWVGYADGATPMESEFGGLPVDGGTLPALIWNDVISAFDAIHAERTGKDEEDEGTETVPGETVPIEPAPTTEPAPVPAPATPTPEPVAPEEAPETPAAPPPEEAAPAGDAPTAGGTSG
jgi:penicillin-binding protein 1A